MGIKIYILLRFIFYAILYKTFDTWAIYIGTNMTLKSRSKDYSRWILFWKSVTEAEVENATSYCVFYYSSSFKELKGQICDLKQFIWI